MLKVIVLIIFMSCFSRMTIAAAVFNFSDKQLTFCTDKFACSFGCGPAYPRSCRFTLEPGEKFSMSKGTNFDGYILVGGDFEWLGSAADNAASIKTPEGHGCIVAKTYSGFQTKYHGVVYACAFRGIGSNHICTGRYIFNPPTKCVVVKNISATVSPKTFVEDIFEDGGWIFDFGAE